MLSVNEARTQPKLPYALTSIGKVTTTKKVVVSIDMGTAYSGVSFAFGPHHFNCRAPGARNNEVKVPTALFRGPDGAFAFGHDAMDQYNDALGEFRNSSHGTNTPKGAALFRFFKMELRDKRAGFETIMVKPFCNFGEDSDYPHSLMNLMSRSLGFLARFALREISCGFGAGMNISKDKDIQWVITVPAIWNDFGKFFMRQAAVRAGIISVEDSEDLVLALEPESASIAVHMEAAGIGLFQEGESFLMVDAGGGTVDISVVQVATLQPLVLDQICAPTGGPWGGMFVDLKFREFLRCFLGTDAFDQLEEHFPTELAVVEEKFRKMKEEYSPCSRSLPKVSLAPIYSSQTLSKVVLPPLEQLVQVFNRNMSHVPFNMSNAVVVKKIRREATLVFSDAQMLQFYEDTLSSICARVKILFVDHPECKTIAIVGGYGSSKVLGNRIRDEFGTAPFNKTVMVPDGSVGPQAAIMVGAVLFGLFTTVIGKRVSSYTYGVRVSIRWFEGCGFPESVSELEAGVRWVNNVFSRVVKKGSPISPDDRFRPECNYQAKLPGQTIVSFAVYKSDVYNPRRVTSDCERLGTIDVPCRHVNDKFELEFRFTTELVVEVVREDGERFRTAVRME